MASCPGKKTKTNGICGGFLYRCKKCGNVGCDPGSRGLCTNQGFAGGVCMKCGTQGQKVIFN